MSQSLAAAVLPSRHQRFSLMRQFSVHLQRCDGAKHRPKSPCAVCDLHWWSEHSAEPYSPALVPSVALRCLPGLNLNARVCPVPEDLLRFGHQRRPQTQVILQLVLKAFSLDSLTGSMPAALVQAKAKPVAERELPSTSGGGMGDSCWKLVVLIGVPRPYRASSSSPEGDVPKRYTAETAETPKPKPGPKHAMKKKEEKGKRKDPPTPDSPQESVSQCDEDDGDSEEGAGVPKKRPAAKTGRKTPKSKASAAKSKPKAKTKGGRKKAGIDSPLKVRVQKTQAI